MNKTPTSRQRQVLVTFARLQRERGVTPTLREVGLALGIGPGSVTGSVLCHFQALERLGLMRHPIAHVARGWQLTSRGQALLPWHAADRELDPGGVDEGEAA